MMLFVWFLISKPFRVRSISPTQGADDDNTTAPIVPHEYKEHSQEQQQQQVLCSSTGVKDEKPTKSAMTPHQPSYLQLLWPILCNAISGRSFCLCVALLGVLLVLPIPPFLQGVLTCLLSIVTIHTLYQTTCAVVSVVVSQGGSAEGPQRVPFSIPNYDKLSVCEIPAAEEHVSLKSYSGWLNEIHSYDPNNYHLGMMKSVFVKLDGTRLKVSNVANRVPKRSMWNEVPIEKKHLIVTRNRTFDLRNCRVEMMPKGLARKRYFNRKYPMQLIIPNGQVTGGTPTAEKTPPGTRNSPEGEETEKLLFLNDFDSTDFGTTILQADTSTLVPQQQQLQVPEGGQQQTDASTPSSEEVRLIFFARADREKEDWYRRFQNASQGLVRDNENPSANYKYVSEKEAQAMRQVTQHLENLTEEQLNERKSPKTKEEERDQQETELQFPPDSQFDGLLMTPCSARSHPDYVKFMSKYQVSGRRGRVLVIFCFVEFVLIFGSFRYFLLFSFRVLVRKRVQLCLR